MTQENTLWKGSSSQWLNLGPFTLACLATLGIATAGLFQPAAFAGLVVPLGWTLWRYLVVRTQVFELTTERLRLTRGVINQQIDEVELYRIKDSVLLRPWWMRLTGLASIEMTTSDRSMPHLIVPAITDGAEVRELLRKHVESQRDRKRVRELDFDETGAALG